MKGSKKPLGIVFVCMGLFMFACVTINIYFPAEKVESVAGDIVNDIRGRTPPQKDNQSRHHHPLRAILAFHPSSAWAEEVITVSNPTIRALKEKMKARFQQMGPYYQKGALKEGNNGYVAMGDTGVLNLKEKRDINSLVEAENNDRRTLYEEVAKAMKIDPSQISRIAEIFAKEWQKSVR